MPGADTWVQWSGTVDVESGEHRVVVRATDSSGYTQTAAKADVVPDGATGWDSIPFERPVVFSRREELGMTEQVTSRRGVLFGALLLGAGVAVSSRGVRTRPHPRLRGAAVAGASPGPGAFKSWTATRRARARAACSWSRRCGCTASWAARRAPRGSGTFHRASGIVGVPAVAAGGVVLPLRARLLAGPVPPADLRPLGGRVRLLRRLRRQGHVRAHAPAARLGAAAGRRAAVHRRSWCSGGPARAGGSGSRASRPEPS